MNMQLRMGVVEVREPKQLPSLDNNKIFIVPTTYKHLCTSRITFQNENKIKLQLFKLSGILIIDRVTNSNVVAKDVWSNEG